MINENFKKFCEENGIPFAVLTFYKDDSAPEDKSGTTGGTIFNVTGKVPGVNASIINSCAEAMRPSVRDIGLLIESGELELNL